MLHGLDIAELTAFIKYSYLIAMHSRSCHRLDAIGAIGIARCFTYGGYFKRVLHDPDIAPRTRLDKQQYTDKSFQQTTINHFHEKLLKLKAVHPNLPRHMQLMSGHSACHADRCCTGCLSR